MFLAPPGSGWCELRVWAVKGLRFGQREGRWGGGRGSGLAALSKRGRVLASFAFLHNGVPAKSHPAYPCSPGNGFLWCRTVGMYPAYGLLRTPHLDFLLGMVSATPQHNPTPPLPFPAGIRTCALPRSWRRGCGAWATCRGEGGGRDGGPAVAFGVWTAACWSGSGMDAGRVGGQYVVYRTGRAGEQQQQ